MIVGPKRSVENVMERILTYVPEVSPFQLRQEPRDGSIIFRVGLMCDSGPFVRPIRRIDARFITVTVLWSVRTLSFLTRALGTAFTPFRGFLYSLASLPFENEDILHRPIAMATKLHVVQKPLQALFDGFAGSEIVIPSVETLCPDWPLRKHPDLEFIRDDFTSWVDR